MQSILRGRRGGKTNTCALLSDCGRRHRTHCDCFLGDLTRNGEKNSEERASSLKEMCISTSLDGGCHLGLPGSLSLVS